VFEALGPLRGPRPRCSEDLDEEHLEQAVVRTSSRATLRPSRVELLAAVAVVLDEALGAEARDHLAHAWRRDAEALCEVAGRDRALVAAQLGRAPWR